MGKRMSKMRRSKSKGKAKAKDGENPQNRVNNPGCSTDLGRRAAEKHGPADAPDSKPRPANITTNHRFENIHDDDVRFTSLRPKGGDPGTRAQGTRADQVKYVTKTKVKYKDDGSRSMDINKIHEERVMVTGKPWGDDIVHENDDGTTTNYFEGQHLDGNVVASQGGHHFTHTRRTRQGNDIITEYSEASSAPRKLVYGKGDAEISQEPSKSSADSKTNHPSLYDIDIPEPVKVDYTYTKPDIHGPFPGGYYNPDPQDPGNQSSQPPLLRSISEDETTVQFDNDSVQVDLYSFPDVSGKNEENVECNIDAAESEIKSDDGEKSIPDNDSAPRDPKRAKIEDAYSLGGAGNGDDASYNGGDDASFGGGDNASYGGGDDASCGGGDDASFGGGDNASYGGGDDASYNGGDDASCGGGDDASFGGGDDASCGGGDDASCGGGDDASYGGGDDASCGGGDDASCGGGDNASCGGGDNASYGGGDNASYGGGDNAGFGGGDDASCGGGDDASYGGGDDASCGGGDDASCGGGDNASCGGGDNASYGGGDNASYGGGDNVSCGGGDNGSGTGGDNYGGE